MRMCLCILGRTKPKNKSRSPSGKDEKEPMADIDDVGSADVRRCVSV